MNTYKGQLMVTYGTLAHRGDVLEAVVKQLSANELTSAVKRDGEKYAELMGHNAKIEYLLSLHPDDLEYAIGRDTVVSVMTAIYPIAL